MNLILTIGISGSGKSTYCSSLGCNYIVINPDRLRGIIGKDESDQYCNAAVFETAKTMVEYFLKEPSSNYWAEDIVIDATNYSEKNRQDFLDIARKHNVKVKAWYFPITLNLAKERNSQRVRKVPNDAIERQYNNMVWPDIPHIVINSGNCTKDELSVIFANSPHVQM